MLCPNCKKPGLDIERAKHNTKLHGSSVHHVSAPCCGAPLLVRCRVVVMSEVDVIQNEKRTYDDWGVLYTKNWRQARMCEHCGEVVIHKPGCVTQGAIREL
jgi:hypothetical protein